MQNRVQQVLPVIGYSAAAVWQGVDVSMAWPGPVLTTGAPCAVQEALRARGLRDDTTCLVIDVMPATDMAAPAAPKKKSAFKRMFS